MKTILKLILVLTILFTIPTGCKKFEDGPRFSLLTKKARITGNWKIENVSLNGNDVTSLYTAGLGSYVLNIKKDGTYNTEGNFPDAGTWKFGEDKDDIYFMSSTPGSMEVANRILRLKNKELWLRYTASNADKTIIKYKQ